MALDEGTQLILLNLSARLSNALDRLNIHTAGDLLRFPLQRIYGLRGVGNKTRRELGSMFKKRRQRLPEVRMDAGRLKSPEPEGTDDAGQAQLETATIETIAQQAASLGKGSRGRTEQTVVHRYLGWESSPGVGATLWPAPSLPAPPAANHVGSTTRTGLRSTAPPTTVVWIRAITDPNQIEAPPAASASTRK